MKYASLFSLSFPFRAFSPYPLLSVKLIAFCRDSSFVGTLINLKFYWFSLQKHSEYKNLDEEAAGGSEYNLQVMVRILLCYWKIIWPSVSVWLLLNDSLKISEFYFLPKNHKNDIGTLILLGKKKKKKGRYVNSVNWYCVTWFPSLAINLLFFFLVFCLF